jgi:hypothetical protein
MKQEIANWMLLIGYITMFVCIVSKFILWIRLRNPKRIGFIKSFFIWFSKNDIHDAASERSRVFLKFSNIINLFLWIGIGIWLLGFVLDTDSLDSTLDPRDPRRK